MSVTDADRFLRRRLLWFTAALSFAWFLSLYWLSYFRPASLVYFVAEDHAVEYLTFVCWLTAGLLISFHQFRNSESRKPALVLLALACLLIAMDEISWGQRLLGFKPPELFATNNIQAETNVHNFALTANYYPIVGIGLLIWTFLIPFMAGQSGMFSASVRRFGIPLIPFEIRPFFVVSALLTVPREWLGLPESDEAFELSFSMSLLALVLTTQWNAGRAREVRARHAIVTLACVAIATVLLLQTGPSKQPMGWLFNYFAAYRFTSAGMSGQALTLFRYIRKTPGLSVDDTGIEEAALLQSLGRDAEAKTILEDVLDHRLPRHDDPVSLRRLGRVYRMLDRAAEAENAFGRAIAIDEALLATGRPYDLYTSMAKTRWAQGEFDAALALAGEARRVASTAQERRRIDVWVEREIARRDALAALRAR